MSLTWHDIRDHLMHSASTLRFQRSFDALRFRQKLLMRFSDPAALLDTLHGGSTITADQKNIILTALVRAAQSDKPQLDCALTVMLLALWPGLDAVRRRARWRQIGPDDELAADVLAMGTEAIRRLDLTRVNRIAATILMNIERDLVRDRQRETERQQFRAKTDPDDLPIGANVFNPDRLHGDVRRLIGRDANLVIRVAMEGYSQVEAAAQLGIAEAAARKRYQRATRRLRDTLHEFI